MTDGLFRRKKKTAKPVDIEQQAQKRKVHFGPNGECELVGAESTNENSQPEVQPSQNVNESENIAPQNIEPQNAKQNQKQKSTQQRRKSGRTTSRTRSFCAKVSKDLPDDQRLIDMVKLIVEHQKVTYFRQDTQLSIGDSIYSGLVENKLPALLSKYNNNKIKSNEKNKSLLAKEKILKYLLTKLRTEEAEWQEVESKIELNSRNEDVKGLLEFSQDYEEANIENSNVDLKDLMVDTMKKKMLMSDQVAICTEQLAQLQRKAKRSNDELVKKIRKETQTSNQLYEHKRKLIMQEAGLTEENEFEILKHIGV